MEGIGRLTERPPKKEKINFPTTRFVLRMMNADDPLDVDSYARAFRVYVEKSGKDPATEARIIERTMQNLRNLRAAKVARMIPLAGVEWGVPGGSVVYPLRMYAQKKMRGKVVRLKGDNAWLKFRDLAARYSPSGTVWSDFAYTYRMSRLIALHRRALDKTAPNHNKSFDQESIIA